MSKNKEKRNWLAILLGISTLIFSILGIFFFSKFSEEQKRRVDAQNQLAEQAEVVRENSETWSRLATQYEDLDRRLAEQGEGLKTVADLIKERDEQITTLSQVVAKIRPTVIRFLPTNVVQTELPSQEGNDQNRIRVQFDEEQDPVRVSGWTLTNPAEAEVSVSFTRPLRLASVVTQQRDGSWRSYFHSDWENLEIEEINTSVNPFPQTGQRAREAFIVGLGVDFTPTRPMDSIGGNIHLLYETNTKRRFTVGPTFGVNHISGESRFQVGLMSQWRLWSR